MGTVWAKIGVVVLALILFNSSIIPVVSADDPPPNSTATEHIPKFPDAVVPEGVDSTIGWQHIELDRSQASFSGTTNAEDEDAEYQTVFPPDERVQVTPTTSFPASAVAYIESAGIGDDFGTCTGTFIGPQVVLTAAHCIYNPDFGGWASSIAVVPGKDGDIDPFGHEFAYNAYVPNAWYDEFDSRYDVGMIILEKPDLGYQVGWLRFGVFSSNTLSDPELGIATVGYPGDKPYGTQWLGAKQRFIDLNDNFLAVNLDAFAGQSGSSIWRQTDGIIIGVLNLETTDANLAVRINMDIASLLAGVCEEEGCQISFYIEPSSFDPFTQVWARTDKPVIDSQVRRTWMWGPQSFTSPLVETYAEGPGGSRTVIYFDKSRMEINDPFADSNDPWYVTNGLLATELVSGRMQLGESLFLDLTPAEVNIAGDQNDPNGPTYASFNALRGAQPIPSGWSVNQAVNRAGQVWDDPALSAHGVTAAVYVPETGHNVASVFWQFMTSNGLVLQNDQLVPAPMFENAFYATGYPITEAYWTMVRVGGVEKQVLVQVFERRVLTYTPDNPAGWQVEAGNVGQHYYQWRYGQ